MAVTSFQLTESFSTDTFNSRIGEINIMFNGLENDIQGKIQMDLLWVNASPTSSFAAQTISLDLSTYDLVFVRCRCNDNSILSEFGAKDGYLSTIQRDTSGDQGYQRKFQVSDTGVYFQGVSGYEGGFSTSMDGYMVPFDIYGIKGINSNILSSS